jgi:hypothetical protein
VTLCDVMLAERTKISRSEINVDTMGRTFHTFGQVSLKSGRKSTSNV